jgi:hypothetical protein
MKLFNQKKSKESVTVNILHRRSDHPKNVKFMNTYCVVNNPKLDLKRTMHKAFNKAHPNWKIVEIDLRKVK